MSYQTYPLFLEGKLILPKGFELRYTIRALANVENPSEEVFGFIAEAKDMIVIAFRGYASYPADLIAAYDILQMEYPYVRGGGKTSRGFTCIYTSARDEIIGELSKLPITKKLYITGHNYGGAIATLAALDIAVNTRFMNSAIYTYASPRVGDPAFVFKFNKEVRNSIRIYNIHDSYATFPDPVYMPPFTEEGLFYQHVGLDYPISFQLNNTPRNDSISCYFNYLGKTDQYFTKMLCSENPGFCPDTKICLPFQKTC
jgi:hypothetical protein